MDTTETAVHRLTDILRVLPDIDLVQEVAAGFAAYSRGKVEVPPVGELLFPDEHGEMHIKYGAIRGDEVFVVKVATGFFGNPERGLPPFGGCMLVLSQRTGQVLSVLLEEGELTNHRTAAAGAVAAKVLAPPHVECIGIVGAGVQARLQADYLRRVTACRKLVLWGRDSAKAETAAADIGAMGFEARTVGSVTELASTANLIVTTTPSHTPLLMAADVRPGTHVTMMGSDTPEKNEVDPDLLSRADTVIADSLAQCLERGEIFHAVTAGTIRADDVVELGAVIDQTADGRHGPDDITVADLTGVAVQDIVIAKAVVDRLGEG
jgi:ornithine cyclodeaminase